MDSSFLGRREFLAALGGGPAAWAAHAALERPNLVLILADDMGFSDLGCYGSEIATPNLGRMASRGVRFTQFYNTARCCPTRASLLTGLYPHQAGVGHMNQNYGIPQYQGYLNDRCVTIAEALRPAGYRTGMAGKWHLSNLEIHGKAQLDFQSGEPFWKDQSSWPAQRGFEEFYGTIAGVGNFYDPFSLVEGNRVVQPDRRDFYYTDAITDRAVRFIERHARREPFFLYTAYTAPHWPMHALERDIARYRDVYRMGWDELRARRHRRQVEMGIVDGRWPLTPRDASVPAWTDAPDKEWQARRMAVYAAMIDRMDQGIGRILGALRRRGVEDNTLVMFLSDNGGCAENVQPQWYDIPSRTRAGRNIQVGNDARVMPGGEETFQSYGPEWANASNTPFRLYKHYIHEGGIAAPFIASWPAAMRRRGTITPQPAHVIDLMATCLDAAGARYPERAIPMQGKSLVPVFQGKVRLPHETLAWEHEGNRAVRQGDWKLVSRFPGSWELYDLAADRTEMQDLAGKEPARAAGLRRAYDAWAERCGVIEWGRLRRMLQAKKKG